MSTSINDVADALQDVIDGITGLTVYSEPSEAPETTMTGASAEIALKERRKTDNCGGQLATFDIDVSVPEARGWSESIRTVRDYLDAAGSLSIEAAIRATQGLGITGVASTTVSAGNERRVKFGDGTRWTGTITVQVYYR